MNENTNPPAFSCAASGQHGQPSHLQEGMSLRDYFAAKALLTLCMTPSAYAASAQTAADAGMKLVDGLAHMSYEIADAMLRARNSHEKKS